MLRLPQRSYAAEFQGHAVQIIRNTHGRGGAGAKAPGIAQQILCKDQNS
jgi:hypothetical protein